MRIHKGGSSTSVTADEADKVVKRTTIQNQISRAMQNQVLKETNGKYKIKERKFNTVLILGLKMKSVGGRIRMFEELSGQKWT